MSPIKHRNFVIDQKVDAAVNKKFDILVQQQMKKMGKSENISEEAVERRIAIAEILIQKEEFKLKEKKKAAEKKKRKKRKTEKKVRQTEESLLKECLLRAHYIALAKEEKKSEGDYLWDLHKAAMNLERELAEILPLL